MPFGGDDGWAEREIDGLEVERCGGKGNVYGIIMKATYVIHGALKILAAGEGESFGKWCKNANMQGEVESFLTGILFFFHREGIFSGDGKEGFLGEGRWEGSFLWNGREGTRQIKPKNLIDAPFQRNLFGEKDRGG